MIEGVPFGKPVDTSRGAVLMPLMMAGGLVMAIVVAIQHFLLFHSRPLVLAVTLLAAAAAWFLTRAGAPHLRSRHPLPPRPGLPGIHPALQRSRRLNVRQTSPSRT